MSYDIEAAALQEAAAEQNRASAETAWRAAWWETTLALAGPDDSDRRTVTAAYDTAVRILGQGRQWLAERRRTGRALKDLMLEAKIISLPPRLAVEYVRAGGDPAAAVEYLTNAEAQGASLRDVAADLGTQTKSWLRESEQDQRPVTAEQVRNALADPDVARDVFATPRGAGESRPARVARINAQDAIARNDEAVRERVERGRSERDRADHGNADMASTIEAVRMLTALQTVVTAGRDLARVMANGATVGAPMARSLAASADRARATIEWVESLADDGRVTDPDEALRTWAAGS